MKIEKITK